MNILLHEAHETPETATSGGIELTLILLVGLVLLAGVLIYVFKTRTERA